MGSIDFVIPWVDGSDPEWRKEKQRYEPSVQKKDIDDGETRYRDWNTLKYWFRGVEKFAPWVNNVYFITWGHYPKWLKLDAPKLHFIKHSDYMDSSYLPTFNSHPIELNLHRIEGLSENFVYFNDDTFLTNYVDPELFFRSGIPIHAAQLHPILPRGTSKTVTHIYVNMLTAINRNFIAHDSLRQNRRKWFSPFTHDFKTVIMNIFNSNYLEFVGFANEHLPVPISKSTMREVWEKETQLLHDTSLRKFRSYLDVSQYLFRYWDIASGRFVPIKAKKLGKRYTVRVKCDDICKAIKKQTHKMICINDEVEIFTSEEFSQIQNSIIDAFQTILPQKSQFEI